MHLWDTCFTLTSVVRFCVLHGLARAYLKRGQTMERVREAKMKKFVIHERALLLPSDSSDAMPLAVLETRQPLPSISRQMA
jgi:hypothetical protein